MIFVNKLTVVMAYVSHIYQMDSKMNLVCNCESIFCLSAGVLVSSSRGRVPTVRIYG